MVEVVAYDMRQCDKDFCSLLVQYDVILGRYERLCRRDNFPDSDMIELIIMMGKYFGVMECGDDALVVNALMVAWEGSEYLRLMKQLRDLNHVRMEIKINSESGLRGYCINRWLVLHIEDMFPNVIDSILGSVFVYYDPNFYFPLEFNGRDIIIQVDTSIVNWSGKRFVRMQGIGANIILLLAKMIFKSHALPRINDYLPQAAINFAQDAGADLIFVDPIGVQADALARHGFQRITSINTKEVEFPPGCFTGNGDFESNIGLNTMVYQL